jgi:hypothetical protein
VHDDDYPVRFCVGALATWRVAHLLAAEDGPADVVVRLRRRAGDGALGSLLDCFYCLSVWAAAPVTATVAGRRREAPLTWLALSGAACLLERATAEKGGLDVLWEQARGGADGGDPAAGEADAREPRGADRERAAATPR